MAPASVPAMKRVYSAADLPQAYLLSHLLDEAGIAHYVANVNLQGGVGELPFTQTYPAIWLYDETDYARARSIIGDFEAASNRPGHWRCSACGEDNPLTFDLCWNCRETRP
jgi:hypothetical protein